MDVKQIRSIWDKLYSSHKSKSITSLKISSQCKPELNLALNSENNRCLILFLKPDIKLDFVPQKRENLKIGFIKKERGIILELTDDHYDHLFDDLIISLYFRIHHISDPKEATRLFLNNITKWSSFLASASEKLSEDTVKGIIGELSILNQFLDEGTKSQMNEILQSWRGLYDATTDFEFDDKNVEVKTKNLNSSIVRISSEYQLSPVDGKNLHLAVVSVVKDHLHGSSLSDMVHTTRKKVEDAGAEISILFDSLAQKGLFRNNLNEYDRYKFKLKNHTFYDCEMVLADGQVFPRIITSEINENVSKLRYNINLAALDSFIIDQKEI